MSCPGCSITPYDRTNGGSVGDFLRIALSSYHPTLFLSGNRTSPPRKRPLDGISGTVINEV